MQGELGSVLGGVRTHCGELKSDVDPQQRFEQLLHSFEEMLNLGSDRLSQHPDVELHSRAQLQQQLSSHTVSVWEEGEKKSVFFVEYNIFKSDFNVCIIFLKQKFFQFLGHHIHILQFLENRVPVAALQRGGGAVTGLQDQVDRLQQHGLEKGIRMQETLQV